MTSTCCTAAARRPALGPAAGAHLPGCRRRLRAGWQARLHSIGDGFVARRLSPGGSADLLACAWFLLQQEVA
jgi:hypothetical protein